MDSSTVSGNTGTSGGGGIVNIQSDLDILNSTISGNDTNMIGGGIVNSGGSLTLTFTTITDNLANQAGGGMSLSVLTADIKNSIIAGNTSPSGNNCQPLSMDAGVNDNGGNISDDNTDLCSSFFNASFNAATMLGLLDDNGGATLTHALIPTAGPSNPAIDLILQADCTEQIVPVAVMDDQRGFQRPFPVPSNCDSGAFELQPVGKLTILKTTDPPGGMNFDFLASSFPKGCGLMGTFFLDDAEMDMGVLPIGMYTVREFPPPDMLADITCTETPSAETPTSVTVDIGDMDDVACTFINKGVTQVRIQKLTIPPGGTGFMFNSTGFLGITQL